MAATIEPASASAYFFVAVGVHNEETPNTLFFTSGGI